jgi:preprotein translocase subunit YajC
VSILPIIVLLFAVMWLLVIRPQRRRQAEQRRILESVAPGEEVLTAGGLYGTVRAVDDDEIRLEIAPGIEVRVSRQAVAAVLTNEESELAELERVQQEAEAEVVTAGKHDER